MDKRKDTPRADGRAEGTIIAREETGPTAGIYAELPGPFKRSVVDEAAGATGILFEQPYRGDLWRLEVTTHNGRTFGNWRKWYRNGGTLRPTKQGVTFPVERLDALRSALSDYLAHSRAS